MIELNKIYNEDCLTGMQRIPDKSIDMILCDLPYGTTQNKWDSVIRFDLLWKIYKRILKKGGVVALTGSQPFTSALVMSNLSWFKHEWIWNKNRGSNFANTVREPMKEHESVLIFSEGRWTYNKQMEERKGGGANLIGKRISCKTDSDNYGKTDGFYIEALSELRVPSSVQRFNTEVGLHPTQKPVALFEYLIKTYTNEGETVLDNCMGSGTTAIACININRNYIGFEKEAKYYNVIQERIKNHTPQLKLIA